MSYVVEQGQDESGNWYRRFSNGWVEQGGLYTTASTYTINFPIEFADLKYTIFLSYKTVYPGGGANESPRELDRAGQQLRTTTSIQIWSNGTDYYGYAGSWEAKGFAA